ncbi:MAG: hypothetical protein DHS20C12_20630 [Pseudohongiella sp.]|nr:MAG: hypothetical protein DHS20C12_20630 [Pseudohongiella sp.]
MIMINMFIVIIVTASPYGCTGHPEGRRNHGPRSVGCHTDDCAGDLKWRLNDRGSCINRHPYHRAYAASE